jgi:hypothetical protein
MRSHTFKTVADDIKFGAKLSGSLGVRRRRRQPVGGRCDGIGHTFVDMPGQDNCCLGRIPLLTATGVIAGYGSDGYVLSIEAVANRIAAAAKTAS